MRQYIVRRLLAFPVVVLAVSILVFILVRIGGSPIGLYLQPGMTQHEVAQLKLRYHLTDPLPVQYMYWLGGVLRGDFGWSAVAAAPVAQAFPGKLAATAELAVAAGVVAVVIGVSLGTFAAKRRNRASDQLARVFAVGGASMPSFWFGILLLIVFFARLRWFPTGRYEIAVWQSIPHPTGLYFVDAILAGSVTALTDAIWHLVLPAVVLGYTSAAIIVRMMRSSLIEELGRDYVEAARAKGLPERLVLRRHARRNALIPTVTVIGLAVGVLFEGTVVVETIFQWPGIGRWMGRAVLGGDGATIMAYVLFISVSYLTVNLIVDIMYGYFDRRVTQRTE